jgi:glycosyltransferase involved in cell wall biosynthesis
MDVCLICPAPSEAGSTGHSPRHLAALLAERHEVTLIHSGYVGEPEPPPNPRFREVCAELPEELAMLKFACDDHRHSAAAMETIRRLYGEHGPDYLEVPDFRAHGLVPLQARRTGDPLLAATTVAVRVSPASELRNLHDGTLRRDGNQRLAELEREQLRLADRLLWPGGDCLDLYRRYYRDLALPPQLRLRPPFELPAVAPALSRPGLEERPLRLLYLGDLRRSLGVVDLVEACRLLPPDSWRLTLVGADTATAAMGQSVRATVEAMSGDDERLELIADPSRPAAAAAITAADLLVAPARLDVSAAAALRAMAAGVPVLTTPVGDLVEVVEDGVSGWHAGDAGAEALGRALQRLEADRGELRRVRDSGEPVRRARELADPERVLAAYEELLEGHRVVPRRPASGSEQPLVTAVIPYYRAPDYVGRAAASMLAQTHLRTEVLIVNDGSFEPADAVLEELAGDPRVTVVTQPSSGESSARALGARLAAGEYVVMLDADNELEPGFVERALLAFREDPGLAYVTCWLRMVNAEGEDTSVHPGYAPLGNAVLSDYGENWDGDTMALLPRRVFTELGFEYDPEGSMHSDWQLYRLMREHGAYGAVVPERLGRYRVLQSSLIRSYPQQLQSRSWSESRERSLLRATRWTAGAAG